MATISLQRLSKHFGTFAALHELDLQVRDQEFMALLGPSGCGKSTTMNLIAGMIDASAGKILFDDRDVTDVAMGQRGVGFVFQNYAIFTHMSVRDNLSFGLRMRRLSRTDVDRRVGAMADLLQLRPVLDQRASGLSVNILQRIAIGRSAIVEPAIYIPPNIGEFSAAGNYKFPSTAAYTVCGWLSSPDGIGDPGGPVTAAASLPLNVRPPAISLSLRFPQPVHVNKQFVLELVATSQVKREVVVEAMPYTKSGCPVNYAAGDEPRIIDTEIDGGPTTTTVDLKALRRGKYIFCAWADPYEDNGLYPQATTSIVLDLSGHHTTKHKAKKKKRRHKARKR